MISNAVCYVALPFNSRALPKRLPVQQDKIIIQEAQTVMQYRGS